MDIYAKQIAPRDKGELGGGGVKGSNIQRSGKAVKRTAALICTNFGSRLRIHLGMGIG